LAVVLRASEHETGAHANAVAGASQHAIKERAGALLAPGGEEVSGRSMLDDHARVREVDVVATG
jgi:hypothetical protein